MPKEMDDLLYQHRVSDLWQRLARSTKGDIRRLLEQERDLLTDLRWWPTVLKLLAPPALSFTHPAIEGLWIPPVPGMPTRATITVADAGLLAAEVYEVLSRLPPQRLGPGGVINLLLAAPDADTFRQQAARLESQMDDAFFEAFFNLAEEARWLGLESFTQQVEALRQVVIPVLTKEAVAELAAELVRTRTTHSRFYARFLAQRTAAMSGGGQLAATDDIAAELPDIRAAWNRAIEQADATALDEAAVSLSLSYQFQSRYREGAEAFGRAVYSLERAAPTPETQRVLAECLTHQGWLLIRLGRLEEAYAALECSQALLEALDPALTRGRRADPLPALGVLALVRGDYAEAARLGEIAWAQSQARSDQGNRTTAGFWPTATTTWARSPVYWGTWPPPSAIIALATPCARNSTTSRAWPWP